MASNRGKKQKLENANESQSSQPRRTRSAQKCLPEKHKAELEMPSTSVEAAPAKNTDGKRARKKSARRVKRECKQKIISEMDQIVNGLIKKAKQGGYNQAKLLLTLADGNDEVGKAAKAAQTTESSLAELLLEQLEPGDEAGAVKKAVGERHAAKAKRKTLGKNTRTASVEKVPAATDKSLSSEPARDETEGEPVAGQT